MKYTIMKKIITYLYIFILAASIQIQAQIPGFGQNNKEFYIDAISFKGNQEGMSRVDVYAVIPYEMLTFEKSDSKYFAKYELTIDIIDSDGIVVKTKLLEKKILADDHYEARGGRGDFDYSQSQFYLEKGDYKVQVNVFDLFGNLSLSRSKNVTVIDYGSYPFAVSGIMLVSSIREKDGKYSITPHISDNIANLKEGFFIFFEAYNTTDQDSVDFQFDIYNSDKDTIASSGRIRKVLENTTNQEFLKVDYPGKDASGIYTLQLTALKPSDKKDYAVEDIKAIAQRSIKIERSLTGVVIKDIDDAINQLRYIASGTEISHIEDGNTKEEKERRFKEFWQKHDPSPNTERNEAFIDYYSRINIANEQFQSYTKGWRTDMGMVYVIFGTPANIESYQQYGGGRTYQKWYYPNHEFIFVDNTGFGDFRLYFPPTVYEKYEYGRY
jgi:GWxTD domain-containing protein